ncbi:MAG: sugar phosphate isomerase/epimerase [Proteobacteria bacterium]|nr:sugar phosphate isomerase/epimerase [Pseudomonadota bacterium]
MTRTYSLAYLTAAPLAAPEAISLAARLGYGAVGLRALPSAPGGIFDPLIDDKRLLRETKRRLADTGITVFDVEIIRLGADFSAKAVLPFLEVCGELNAKAVLVAGDDPDEARLTASFAAFCEAATPFGVTGDLEFMAWTAVKDAKSALRIVTAAGQPNGGILVDTLHAGRSTTTLDDLLAIPASRLHYAQICDATPGTHFTDAELIHTARQERLLPGEGTIDITGMFAALPATLPVSIELPNDGAKDKLGVEEWARRGLETAKAVIAGVIARR